MLELKSGTVDEPFTYLDQEAIAAAELRRDPYDYAFVDQSIPLQYKNDIIGDAPVIPHRGTYGIPDLKFGPKFETMNRSEEATSSASVCKRSSGLWTGSGPGKIRV